MKLLLKALVKFIAGLILVGGLLFLPAGTIVYPNGWLFLGLLFIPMLILGVVLFFKSPELLEKRLNAKERATGCGCRIGASVFSGIPRCGA